jgi:hypothetical protein
MMKPQCCAFLVVQALSVACSGTKAHGPLPRSTSAASADTAPAAKPEAFTPRPPAVPAEFADALERGETLQLLSLFPYPRRHEEVLWKERGYDQGEVLGDYAVLGRTELEPTARRRLVNAFYKAVAESDAMAACFEPRHAIRVRSEHATFEAVICFACGQVDVTKDGKPFGGFSIALYVPRAFDDPLRRAGIPMSDL